MAGGDSRARSVTHDVGHVMDVMATCVEIAGATYPKEFQGHSVTPMEGRSLLPTLRGEKSVRHEFLAWEHFGARAIREGDWKLVIAPDGALALYDLSKDRAETSDLAGAEPDRVRAMQTRWEQWAKGSNVFPAPPAGRP